VSRRSVSGQPVTGVSSTFHGQNRSKGAILIAVEAGRGRLEVAVLGPSVIADGERPIEVPRRLERALAVRLALARGAAVSDDVLARDLWGDDESARPAERLRVVASRLRTALGPAAAALERSAAGYRLDARPADLIAMEASLAGLAAALRTGDPAAVRDAAGATLRRFRGPALSDLRSVPFARAEGERLDGLYLDVLVERLAAESGVRPAVDLLAELGELARTHPLHERIARLRAITLYRDGRPADALAVLAELRTRLADELGVDPAPDTARLEVDILRQEPGLLPEPSVTSAPAPTTAVRAGLPRTASSFVGRDGELAALVELVREPLLITLTGSPGSGKTRLALEVALHARETGRPVVWLDLAPLPEAAEIAPALAAAAGVPSAEVSPDDVVAACAGALAGGLLVVDNAEHLVEPVSTLVARLMRAAPELTVLVTSQRPLLLAGEEIHHVGALSPLAAAALFAERSGASPDEQVASICAAVDHLPLGVELAAGLTRTLTVAQIAARIDDRLRLLVGGARDAGDRHTSLRAAVEWSHRLLDPVSAAVLRRLAVFAAGCSLEAAEAVVPDGSVVHAADVAGALTDLVDRCLVAAGERRGERRFTLLESVRAYALERLAAEDDEEAVRARHLAWCRHHVASHDVQGEDTAGELEAVFAEWPDLLAALSDAPGTPRAADALELAVALDDPWMFRGWHDQARRHYGALVDAEGASDALRAQALSNFGFSCSLTGDTERAAGLLDRATALAESAGVPELAMRVLYHRGIAAVEDGRPRDARGFLQDARVIAVRLERERAVSAIDDVLATVHHYTGDAATAVALFREINAGDRAAGHHHGLVRGLVNEAAAALSAGDVDAAEVVLDEAETVAERLEDVMAQSTLTGLRGQVALARGDVERAVDLLTIAASRFDGSEIHVQLCHLDLANALVLAGRIEAARTAVDAVLAAANGHGMAWLVAQPTLAELMAARSELDAAAELVRRTRAEFAARGFAWQPAVERLERATAATSIRA
jgi:predicted ATPase/DNA-binding SARP family transcriptional activator